MQREGKLRRKREALQEELTAWAKEQRILLPGQVLVFSMRIEDRSLVEQNGADDARYAEIELPVRGEERRYQREFQILTKPAVLTSVEIEYVLKNLKGIPKECLRRLLVDERNNPTSLAHGFSYKAAINRTLRELPNRRVRFVSKGELYQVWEYDINPDKH